MKSYKCNHLFDGVILNKVILLVGRQLRNLDDLVLSVLRMLAIKILRQLILPELEIILAVNKHSKHK